MIKKSEKWLDIFCPVTGECLDISPQKAARLTGRSLPTVRKWAERRQIPTAEQHLLRGLVLGMISDDPNWSDFRIRNGRLTNIRSGENWSHIDLSDTLWWRQLADESRRTVDRLTDDLRAAKAALRDALSQRPHGPTPWQRRTPRRTAVLPAAVQLTLPAIPPAHPWHTRQKKARY